MGYPYDVISAAEHDRLAGLYEPFARAIRELVDVGVRTEVDPQTIAEATAAVEAISESLRRDQSERARVMVHAETGKPVVWANPVIGLRNAVAPPLVIEHSEDGTCWSEFVLGAAYEGPSGWVHGGICALVLDHILGEVASDGLNEPRYTGTITCRYRRGTPLGPLRAEAYIDRTEGVKTYARGHISDAEGITVEAEGVFITPAWARDAG
ncbi:PaaI family thioesterase [Mycobacterium sp. NPDC003449]